MSYRTEEVIVIDNIWILYKQYNQFQMLEKQFLWGIKVELKKEIKMIVNNDVRDYKENQVNLFSGMKFKEMLIIVTVDQYNIRSLINL